MVSLDLGGSWAKLNHAKLHVDTLRQAIKTATPNEDLISLGRKYDDKEQEVIYFIDDIAVIDPEWSLLVGDAVHDMRSALDHIMWQLARRHLGRAPTEKEAKSIQFPEVRRLKEFTNNRFLRYVEPDDIARLKLFQPYKRLRKGQLHPLPKLVKLSNIDKHRRLHLIVVRPFSASFTNRLDAYRDCVPDFRLIPGNAQPVDWVHTAPSRRPRKNDVILRVFVQPTGPHPDVELDARVIGQITSGEHRSNIASA